MKLKNIDISLKAYETDSIYRGILLIGGSRSHISVSNIGYFFEADDNHIIFEDVSYFVGSKRDYKKNNFSRRRLNGENIIPIEEILRPTQPAFEAIQDLKDIATRNLGSLVERLDVEEDPNYESLPKAMRDKPILSSSYNPEIEPIKYKIRPVQQGTIRNNF